MQSKFCSWCESSNEIRAGDFDPTMPLQNDRQQAFVTKAGDIAWILKVLKK